MPPPTNTGVTLLLLISVSSAQYYVVNYPQQSQAQYYLPQSQQYQPVQMQQLPQQVYQQQFVPQPAPQQYRPQPQQLAYQPQQYLPQAPPQQQYYQPQQQQVYAQKVPQAYQQVQQSLPAPYKPPQVPQQVVYQPVQQVPQQAYQQQQIPQQVPQPVPQQVPQQPQSQARIVESDKDLVSANTYEFDLPPPPPSRFLPDNERVKILQSSKPGRPEATRQVRPQRPTQRVGDESRHDRQHRPEASTVVPLPRTSTPKAHEASQPPVSHLSPKKGGGAGGVSTPNKIFLQCCKNKKVAKSCESRCNFDNINKKVLTAMFLGSDPCPQSYGLDLFACAAQDSDHTPCCRANNVQRTSAGEKCLAFCNLRPDSHFQADASYLPCWAVLNDVKTCFKDAIIEKHE